MKTEKAEFTVNAIKPRRERQLEGEAEGRLAKAIMLEAKGMDIAKIEGLYSTPASYARKVLAHYDAQGQLLDEDGGTAKLNTEGRACMAQVLYGLVDTQEFQDSGLDGITVLLQQGRVATVKCCLLLHPKVPQLAKIDQWLKNKITLTLNGNTAVIAEKAEEEEQSGQQRMDIGGGAAPAAGHGVVEPGDEKPPSLNESLRTFDEQLAADLRANDASVAGLQEAGVLRKNETPDDQQPEPGTEPPPTEKLDKSKPPRARRPH